MISSLKLFISVSWTLLVLAACIYLSLIRAVYSSQSE